MANPELIDGFDKNDTNTQPIPDNLINNGYTNLQVVEAYEHNELFKQLFAAANKNKHDGIWDWDTAIKYSIGALVRYSGAVYQSLKDLNESTPADDGVNWHKIDLGNYVKTVNNQTIAGVKTFSSNPLSSATQSTAVNALTRRDFVTGLDSTNVKTVNNQTIAGVKTFTSSPIVPTPTTNTQAANKGYVDGKIDTNIFYKPTGDSVLFTKASASSITIPVGTKVLAGANIIEVLTTAYTLSLNSVGVGALDTGTKTAGTDYYVYALEAGGFIVSASATNPTGYTTANSRKIGGFHYGVIPEAFTAINNITASDATKIAGINSYTFWDLKFMPVNGDPRGMFFANSRWYDLYLCNTDHHLYGTSAAGKTIAGGAILNGRTYPKIPLFYGGDGTVTYGTFTWFEASELGQAYGKESLSYDEFVAVAFGVLENSSASTLDTDVTQHLANYTSKFGMCMAAGCQWIWSKNVFSDTSGTFGWQAVTESRGQVYSVGANPKTAILGGRRDLAAASGSRASYWNVPVWGAYWDVGARFACDHLVRA